MHDIVIIGAGLAGSSLAAELAGRGWDVVLLERRQLAQQHKVCGEFLSPESQDSLRAMGLYDAVAALGPAPMTDAVLLSRRGVQLRVRLPGRAWGVSRFALDAALMEAAAQRGAAVRLGAAVSAVQAEQGSYEVIISGRGDATTSVRARAVVAACGRHPPPGLRTSADAPHARPSYVGVKCHYAGLDLPAEVRLYLFDGGYVGLCPIEGGRANVCMLVDRATFAQAGSVPAMIARAGELNPTFARHLAGGRALPEAAVAVAPVDTGRPAAPWDRFARIGDAAVMIPPLCGDGMAMALRGAELCAPLAHAFLRGDRSLAAWQAAHCAAWHHEFDGPVWIGRQLQHLLSLPGVSGTLLGIGALLPPLSSRLVRATRGQLRPREA
jgi:flavin-dependent dehydrogenase